MKKIILAASVVVGLAAAPALAAVPSVLGGNAMGTGTDVVHAQVGWPGVSGTYLHGYNDKTDIGVKFGFNYGFESLITTFGVNPGLKLQGVLRYELVDKPTYNIGLRIEPGFFTYFDSNFIFGMTLPVGVHAGFPINEKFSVHAVGEIPFSFGIGDNIWIVPFVVGGGVEYSVTPDIALTATLRTGPALVAFSGGSSAEFYYQTLVGAAFKI